MANFLKSLNTHTVSLIGILGLLAGLVTDPSVNAFIHLLPDKNVPEAQVIISKVSEIAGFALAYFGRPKTIPAGK